MPIPACMPANKARLSAATVEVSDQSSLLKMSNTLLMRLSALVCCAFVIALPFVLSSCLLFMFLLLVPVEHTGVPGTAGLLYFLDFPSLVSRCVGVLGLLRPLACARPVQVLSDLYKLYQIGGITSIFFIRTRFTKT